MSNSNKVQQATSTTESEDFCDITLPKRLYPLLIYAILKVHSSKDKPLPINKIARHMIQWIMYNNYDNELPTYENPTNSHYIINEYEQDITHTIRTHINSFIDINDYGHTFKDSAKNITEYTIHTQTALYLSACFCGTIRCANPQKNKNKTYYFDPFLSDSDISMFTGTVITNPYFSEDEKDLLLQLRPLLNGGNKLKIWADKYTETAQNVFSIFQNRTKRTPENNRILKNIKILYENIKSNSPKAIRIKYGRYGAGTNAKRYAQLDEKNQPESQDIELNPYGIVWKRGFCYLITSDVTDENNTDIQVRHRRVDRILKIDILDNKPRQDVPEILKPYFEKKKFNPKKYASEHPMMSRYKNRNIERVQLECDNMTASIITDAFGTNVKLVKSELSERPVTIWEGKELTNLTATVEAQYEDILEFCVEFHKSIYVTDKTSNLFKDVKKVIEQSYNWYCT